MQEVQTCTNEVQTHSSTTKHADMQCILLLESQRDWMNHEHDVVVSYHFGRMNAVRGFFLIFD